MLPPRPTQLARMILQESIRSGDTVIDATAGNGHDTAFLAECVGQDGRVLAFDVQDEAIQSARERVAAAGYAARVVLHHLSHARMAEFAAAGTVTAVIFNLGYLPGNDHAVTTLAAETLSAMAAAAGLLKAGGVLAVTCYPGHPAGAQEAIAVENWLTVQTGDGWKTAKYAMLGTLRPAPYLLLARKP